MAFSGNTFLFSALILLSLLVHLHAFFTETTDPNKTVSSTSHDIQVASIRWDYVSTPFICTSFVILAGLAKISFHHAEFLSSLLPESCLLIILGTMVGIILYVTDSQNILPGFNSRAFFLYLLPPIILDSAYSLHDPAFFGNLPTILLYAVLGTVMNSFLVGLSLFGLFHIGALGSLDITLTECLLFSTLISAVDPVAVLAIFQDLGVNKPLYFLVFGESLLNDAVTVVLYTTVTSFNNVGVITLEGAGLGILSFIVVSLGALAIGILMGILTALITKQTTTLKVVEPLAMLGVAYFSYLLAELFHFSGIISIIGCGLVQAQYAAKNISQKSNVTVKYFSKMACSICDTIIFLFLGLVLVNENHVWSTEFVLWTTLLCIIYRFINVFSLTFISNSREQIRKIGTNEQFIMAYGGLRGAVAFSLVIMIEDSKNKHMFVTSTLFIVLFTVFILGGTMKPLVRILQIRTHAENTTGLFSEINTKVIENLMSGVEEIVGWESSYYWKILITFKSFNDKHLKKLLRLTKSNKSKHIKRVYDEMVLADHYATLYGPATAIEDNKGDIILQQEVDTSLEGMDNDMIVVEESKAHEKKKNSLVIDMKPDKSGKKTKLNRQQSLIARVYSKKFPEPDEDADILMKAIKENPYNKRFHKYNPNLVSEGQQDISSHLKARQLRARRLSVHVLPREEALDPSSTLSRFSSERSSLNMYKNPSLKAQKIFQERAELRRSIRRSVTKENQAPPDLNIISEEKSNNGHCSSESSL